MISCWDVDERATMVMEISSSPPPTRNQTSPPMMSCDFPTCQKRRKSCEVSFFNFTLSGDHVRLLTVMMPYGQTSFLFTRPEMLRKIACIAEISALEFVQNDLLIAGIVRWPLWDFLISVI